MKRGSRKPSPAFLRSAARTGQVESPVSEAVLKQARKSGQLNLSNKSLEVVPSSVWRINTDPPPQRSASFAQDEKWWDQVDLVKLILANNQIKEISDDIRLLTALTVLDVHSNEISVLPEAIGELEQLKRLILSHNELCSIPASICALGNLQILKLDHNKVSDLPSDFDQFVHLEELDVSHNQLTRLPCSLASCRRINILAATNNKLLTVPEGLGSLANLKQLLLSNNQLSSLPHFGDKTVLQILFCNYNVLSELPHFASGSTMKELHYGNNQLKSLDPQRLRHFTSLVYLDVRENRISSIPECIVDVATLERLDLTGNDLSNLPYVMGTMPNLKSLMLDGNPFRGLRRDIIQRGTMEVLKYLRSRIQTDDVPEPEHNTTKRTPTKHTSTEQRTIPQGRPCQPAPKLSEGVAAIALDGKSADLSTKGLTVLPESLFSEVHLTSLNVSKNNLTSLPATIAVFTAITVLDLRNNHIRALPQELEKCSKIREIVLSYNQFAMLPPVLYSLKALENIIAHDNQCSISEYNVIFCSYDDLGCQRERNSLRRLAIGQIGSIDVDGLLQLPMVSCLDLHNNSITQVPPRLATVTTLKHVELGGNPFRIPRAAILSKGTAAILDYLRDRIPT